MKLPARIRKVHYLHRKNKSENILRGSAHKICASQAMLEDSISKLSVTAQRIRFYGQRAYMELVNLHFAMKAIPICEGEKIRIHFVHISGAYWQAWQSLYQACIDDGRIDVQVILLDSTGTIKENSIWRNGKSFLEASGIPYIDYNKYDPELQSPHIMVYQSPYNSIYEYFRKVSCDLIKLRGIRPVYISYGIEYDKAYNWNYLNDSHYHHYVQSLAWRLFIMHQDIKDGFSHHCRTGSAHVHASFGHPKFDVYTSEKKIQLASHIEEKRRGRKLIAYQVHHPNNHDSKDQRKTHSMPIKETIAIINHLISQDDFLVVITIHPLFETKMIQFGMLTLEEIKRLKEMINNSSNTILYSQDYQALIANADAFITEQSSLMIEMAFMKKPVLYLYGEPRSLKPFAEELAETFYHGKKLGDVRAYLDMLCREEDPQKVKRDQAWDHCFAGYDGSAGFRIKEHILDALLSEGS